MSPEEEVKVIAHMRAEAAENLKKAADKSASRWIKNHRVKVYVVGEKVWVRQRIPHQRKGRIWQRTATIHKIKGNHSYRLLWGEQGGYDQREKPYSVSFRFWNGKDLKPRIERSPDPSDSESDPNYEEDQDEDEEQEGEEEIEKEVEEANEIPPLVPLKPKRLAKRKKKQQENEEEEEKIVEKGVSYAHDNGLMCNDVLFNPCVQLLLFFLS